MRTNDRIQFEIVKQLIQFCLRVDDRVFAVFQVDVHESMRIKTTIRSHPLFWMVGSIEVYNNTTIKIDLLQTSQENSRARIRKWTKRSCNIVINFDSNCDQVNECIEGTNKHLHSKRVSLISYQMRDYPWCNAVKCLQWMKNNRYFANYRWTNNSDVNYYH